MLLLFCCCCYPDITRLMARSRNYTELEIAWRLWRDATGRHLKDMYAEFVQLGNQGVQELGQPLCVCVCVFVCVCVCVCV